MSGSQNSCETPKPSNDYRTNGGIAEESSDSEEHPSLSASQLLSLKRKKIVLHIDLNNTILVSDAVTKQGTAAALEYFLSTVTWGRMAKGEMDISCCWNLSSLLDTAGKYDMIYQHCDKLCHHALFWGIKLQILSGSSWMWKFGSYSLKKERERESMRKKERCYYFTNLKK